MLADYHVIRKRKLRLNELYIGNAGSSYWFRNGVNWRAFVAFLCGMWPLLRKCIDPLGLCAVPVVLTLTLAGLVATVDSYTGDTWTGWTRLYNLTFIVGLAISFLVFWALCYFSPVPGLGIDTPFVDDTGIVIGSSSPVAASCVDVEKTNIKA